MKEFKTVYNVKDWDLDHLTNFEGWTIVNIFPSEFEQYEVNRYKSTELAALLCREKTEHIVTENKSCLRSDIETKIIDILSEHLEIEKSLIQEDSRLASELYMDSLDRVEIIVVLEREFKIKISDEDAKDFFTVNDIINYIIRNVQK